MSLYSHLWETAGWCLIERPAIRPGTPRYAVANDTRRDLSPRPWVPHDLRAQVVAKMVEAGVRIVALADPLADPKRETIRQLGFGELIYGGLDAMLEGWERRSQHILTNRTYTEDDFGSFVFERHRIQMVLDRLKGARLSGVTERLALVDEAVHRNLVETRNCTRPSADLGGHPADRIRNWYFFRRPKEYGVPEAWRSIEAWGIANDSISQRSE